MPLVKSHSLKTLQIRSQTLALSCFLLFGCTPRPDLNEISLQHKNPVEGVNSGNLSVLVLSASHEKPPKRILFGLAKRADRKRIELVFVADKAVQQSRGKNTANARSLSRYFGGDTEILILPPRTYSITQLTVGKLHHEHGGEIAIHNTLSSRKNLSPDDFRISLAPGAVVYAGHLISSYSRNDRAWLDLRVEDESTRAAFALRREFGDEADKLIGRLETRLLKVPNKIW